MDVWYRYFVMLTRKTTSFYIIVAFASCIWRWLMFIYMNEFRPSLSVSIQNVVIVIKCGTKSN